MSELTAEGTLTTSLINPNDQFQVEFSKSDVSSLIGQKTWFTKAAENGRRSSSPVQATDGSSYIARAEVTDLECIKKEGDTISMTIKPA